MSNTIFPVAALSACLLLATSGLAANPAEASAPEVAAPASADFSTLMSEGQALWVDGQLDAAADKFLAAAALDPKSVEARMKLGGVYVANKNFPGGTEAFKEAIGIDPDNANAFVALGVSYLHAGNGLAHAAFEEALRLDPSKFKQLEPIMKRLEERAKMTSRHGLSEHNAPGHP